MTNNGKLAGSDDSVPAQADDPAHEVEPSLAPWLNGAKPYVPPPSPPGLIYYSRREGSPDDEKRRK